jgi:transposase
MKSSDSGASDWREWRRFRALELARFGWKQRDIAFALDASEAAVSEWLAVAELRGPEALRSRMRPGPASKLTQEQLRLLPDFLWHGAEAFGFRGELWTCERVAEVLGEEFGVSLSRSQVSRLLKRLGWTPQVPITRAIQRDEEVIARWQAQTWPVLKEKARRLHLTLVFVDESGFYLLPSVVKTYAPQGITPILDAWQTRDHLSVIGAVTDNQKVYSLVREESLTGLHTIEFLIHLMRMVGNRLLVIWDRSPIHRRGEVQAFLRDRACRHIHVEALPPYAPELNPVEWLWQHLKDTQLRNVSCLDLEQLHMEFHLALGRLRHRTAEIGSLFRAAKLNL